MENPKVEKTPKSPKLIKVEKTPSITKVKTDSVEALISQAINKKVNVETIEKLLTMRRELKAEWAREQYNESLAKFQAECPVIKKTKIVRNKDGTARYSYATLESIVEQIRVIIKNYGFSYTTDAIVESDWVTAVCKVTHAAGHSEVSSFKIPIDKESFMSAPHKFAAALTFAKRYAFCNAFGILTGDEDNNAIEVRSSRPTYNRPPMKSPAKVITGDPVSTPYADSPLSPDEKTRQAKIKWIKVLVTSGKLQVADPDKLTLEEANKIMEDYKRRIGK